MKRSSLAAMLLFLSSCTFITSAEQEERRDQDGDGVGWVDGEGMLDCDDLDPTVGTGLTFYADSDGDGHGDENSTVTACEAPEGYVSNADDCDDSDASVSPDAIEQCNSNDDNCNGVADDGAEDAVWYFDADGDGFGDDATTFEDCVAPTGYVAGAGDCDDSNAAVSPTSPEVCDGLDNDCDGDLDLDDDDAVDETFFTDADGDGFGDASAEVVACGQPDGTARDAGDCNDADASVSPAADEVCNEEDDDCDGLIDDDDDVVVDPPAWLIDADGDGFGDDATAVSSCTQPEGTVPDGGDCDDTTNAVRPGAPEVCNGVDDNCSGEVDDASDATVFWYADLDGDGYGDGFDAVQQCTPPEGYVGNDGDCDDSLAEVSPDADEVCDGIDNNCDQRVDEKEAVDAVDFYIDQDGDGSGTDSASQKGCVAPDGFAADNLDCDDADPLTSPDAPELCDGFDNDCDGAIDNDAVAVTWFADLDADGFGDPDDTVESCAPVADRVLDGDDCDDDDDTINPDGTEVCNGVDDDCDTLVDADDDDAVQSTYFADADGDGFGLESEALTACGLPDGYSEQLGDCDDADAAVNPDAAEVCNSIDDNCDDLLDDDDPSTTGKTTWYADADADTFGDFLTTLTACAAPDGYIQDGSDCDDADAAVSPSADELCDSVDNNCDGEVDEETATDASTWYIDADGDGAGVSDETAAACDQPSGFSASSDDCDDTDASTFPGAQELCDTLDNNCDGTVDNDVATFDYFRDADGDSFGDPSDTLNDCKTPDGYVTNSSDCDDTSAVVNPDADEVCNAADDDCDGRVDAADPDVTDAATFYADTDADGFGNEARDQVACAQPSGFVADSSDCNDTNDTVYPGASEVCDSVDNDCDGAIDDADSGVTGRPDWARDLDDDGFGDAAVTVKACVAPGGYIANQEDCDDAQAAINPDASEVCDSQDNDCDGTVDEPDADDAQTWYVDSDGDTYGNVAVTTPACSQPSGYVSDDTDCDDDEPLTNPGAIELCDTVDNDCNGDVDDGVANFDFYADVDGDTYGDPSVVQNDCKAPTGFVGNSADCDDADGAVNPGADEVCNGYDDDCNGDVDTADAGITDATAYFRDRDSDAYGDAADSALWCNDPGAAWSLEDTDCDDTDVTINPAATEVCGDGVDNDCSGDKNSCVGWSGVIPMDDLALLEGDAAGDEAGTSIAWAPDMDGSGGDDIWVGGPGAGKNDEGEVYLLLSELSGTVSLGSADVTIKGKKGYRLGTSVAADFVNAGGEADLLVGAPGLPQGRNTPGGAMLFLNPLSVDPSKADEATATLFGERDGDAAGEAVALVDLNGDSFGDVVVGAPGWDGGNTNEGRVYIFNGPSISGDLRLASAGATIDGASADGALGSSLSGAGDVDGDGDEDLLIGAPGFTSGGNAERGAAFLMVGALTGAYDLAAGDYEARMLGEGTRNFAGTSVAGAGDVNGDGYDDVIIGAPNYWGGVRQQGAAYVVLGPITGSRNLSTADARLEGGTNTAEAGWAVAGIGDGDGDGFAEVAVGAPGADGGNGRVYVMRGPFSGVINLSTSADAIVSGTFGVGGALAGGGDHNGDSYDDLLVASPGADLQGNNDGMIGVVESAGGL